VDVRWTSCPLLVDGFLGGEYGWSGKPDAFAAKLRDVLEGEE
jgi:hypothetical protein